MNAHALLSASSSKRWLECTPSARINEQYAEEVSIYAAEGTLAHEFAEAMLSNKSLTKLRQHKLYREEMESYVKVYVDFINNKKGIKFIEQRLHYANYAPEGFGTGDAIVILDDLLEVIDLKYGRGVAVYANHNTQLMLYALGALNLLDCISNFKRIKMTIVQPRLDNISIFEMNIKELLSWGESIKAVAEIAWMGEGDKKAGPHCRFCKHKGACIEYKILSAKKEFEEVV